MMGSARKPQPCPSRAAAPSGASVSSQGAGKFTWRDVKENRTHSQAFHLETHTLGWGAK